MKKLILLILVIFVFHTSFAQNQPVTQQEELNSDRPRKGNGARVVPEGLVQIEMGAGVENEKDNIYKQTEYHLPEVLVRFGLFRFAELRVQGQLRHNRFNFTNYPYRHDITTTGLTNIYTGTKIQLLRNNGSRPDIALQADFRIPFKNQIYYNKIVEPKISLNFNFEISDRLDLQYNIGVDWKENDPFWDTRKYSRIGIYTLALNYKFADNFSGFIETFGELEERYRSHSIDFGFVYKISPNLQLDASTGFGLTDDAPDFLASLGLSFRLPKKR